MEPPTDATITSSSSSDLFTTIGSDIQNAAANAHLLVVGAGGIGCELLKNLVMTGFTHIDIVDLDTIDISNLNRQLLFRRQHVGKSKAETAKEAIMKLRPTAKITAYNSAIQDAQFDTIWFEQFDYVLNALDNTDARRHVNRICIALDIPLIESGSAGFSGQVFCIKSKQTICYECEEKPTQKSYPICTIRQAPTKPEHCIAWAKLLFELLCSNTHEENALSDLKETVATPVDGGSEEIVNYCFKMYTYLFNDEIRKLAELSSAWKDKTPPRAALEIASNQKSFCSSNYLQISPHKAMSIEESTSIFLDSLEYICKEFKCSEVGVPFDKDNVSIMKFVAAASNIRMYNFHIPLMSQWDIQSIAGAIIPAVASTNAIVAAVQVIQLLHLVEYNQLKLLNTISKEAENGGATKNGSPPTKAIPPIMESKARRVWVNSYATGSDALNRGNALLVEPLEPPKPECYVCQNGHIEVLLHNLQQWSLQKFVKTIVKGALGCSSPNLDVGTRNIYDAEYTEENDAWKLKLKECLKQWNIRDGTFVTLTDYSQGDFQCDLLIKEDENLKEDEDSFRIISSRSIDELKSTTKRHLDEVTEEDGTQETKRRKMETEDALLDEEDDIEVI